MADALQTILTQAGLAIAPLRGIKTADQAVAFFRKLGYEIPSGAFGSALSNTAAQGTELVHAIEGLVSASDEDAVFAALANIFGRLTTTIQAINDLHTQIQSGGGAGLPHIADLPLRLTDFLILDLIDRFASPLHEALHFLGLIEKNPNPTPDNPMRVVNWDRIGTIFSKPGQLFDDVYQWNTNFDTDTFLTRLGSLMNASGIAGGAYPQADSTRTLLGNTTPGLTELRFPLLQAGITPGTYALFGFNFTPAEAVSGNKKGLAFLPFLMGTAAFNFGVCDRGTLTFTSSGDITGIGLVLRPPLNLSALLSLSGAFKASVEIAEKQDQTSETILFGTAGGTRLSVQGLGMTGFIQNTGGKLDLGWEGNIGALRVVINGGDGDGFLQKILSGINVDASAALTFGVSLLGGFYFKGGAQLALQFPLHIDLGPLQINNLTLTIEPAADHFNLSAGATLNLSLGPLQGVVENIGITSALAFHHGNLGPADLSFGFKPPDGAGLSIDAAVVQGGGYLYFNTDREEYAGVLELSIADIVTVKAIGLITTKMPDGSKGFSLLVIITAEFGTGIQLGFGFTLIGLGGLLGLNRTMLLEPLAAGIQTGAINSIMFPPDPVANAPRIISDLQTYFPPNEGTFLIGPMVKIGWGTPTLISLAFGIIIEIPGNVAIVGILSVALPTEDEAIIELNVAFVGALEFDKKRIWFFASLFDSHILFITMEGQMGLLMDFSSQSNFVLSVGGFHPQFNPPPLPFPNPRRIELDILRNALARITATCYFAITSNTVQFGCSADLFYGIDAFNIHGNLSFDALFQFSPFHFIIDISFSIGMDVFGAGLFSINLKLHLEGPAPWRASGTGTLSIDLWLFSIDISVSFDITWGDANNPTLPSIPALPVLTAEVNKVDNWRAEIPENVNLLVSLRKLDASEGIVLHPVGYLKISQRALPLGIHIDKVGNNPVSDAHLFSLDVGSADLVVTTTPPTEKFAIAEYQDLSDADKLSRPSFQDLPGGVELQASGRQLGSGKVAKRIVRYELKIIDGDGKYQSRQRFRTFNGLFWHWLGGAAITRSPLSFAVKKNKVPTTVDQRVKVGQPGYVVAGVDDNKPLTGSPIFASEAHARDYFNSHISNNPGMAEDIHVIPTFEAASV